MNLSARAWFRKWHKWPSLVLSLFILLFALSGIVLNHRAYFSSISVNRNCLPPIYRYKNWNLAAVKGGLRLNQDTTLVYGNIGIWISDSSLAHFSDNNQGLPKGIDHRKVNSMAVAPNGDLYAGTLFGLYYKGKQQQSWTKITLPIEEERIVKLLMVKEKLWVMSRSYLLSGFPQGIRSHFERINVPPGEDDDQKAGLFKTLWVIHSGEIYGMLGRYFVDFVAFVFIFLTSSGFYYFLTPYFLKKSGEKAKANFRRVFKFNLRWHKRFGSWLIVILLLTTLSGVFLRPPLLIAIANSRVGKIPNSLLDDPNPWYDKFRDILVDDSAHRILFATSEGIYYSGDSLKNPLISFPIQPEVSVMGINVLEKVRSGEYLVGSFSGLFRWIPASAYIEDYITKEVKSGVQEFGKPFGNVVVAGYIRQAKREILFDYATGAFALQQGVPIVRMPEEVLRATPMSLWSLSLEIHTCRIYEFLIGNFYILMIPLTGIGIAFSFVTGYFSWYKGRRIKRYY
ncbi:MAG: PepSY domain-containing protein [Bacteroidota bacterium]